MFPRLGVLLPPLRTENRPQAHPRALKSRPNPSVWAWARTSTDEPHWTPARLGRIPDWVPGGRRSTARRARGLGTGLLRAGHPPRTPCRSCRGPLPGWRNRQCVPPQGLPAADKKKRPPKRSRFKSRRLRIQPNPPPCGSLVGWMPEGRSAIRPVAPRAKAPSPSRMAEPLARSAG